MSTLEAGKRAACCKPFSREPLKRSGGRLKFLMQFNTIEFAVFLPLVFIIYWKLLKPKPLTWPESVYSGGSYFFYAGGLAFFIPGPVQHPGGLPGGAAIGLADPGSKRKALLALSLVCNLGLLCTFKYFNFFIEKLCAAFAGLGINLHITSLNLILPIGISFYTFQTLSYTIDVYRKKIEPTRDFIAFCGFVSFFSQLVAGPIERASNLLPQFLSPRKFEYNQAVDGLRQILWGLLKKS